MASFRWPGKVWEWLLFLSPAAVSIFCGAVVPEIIVRTNHFTPPNNMSVWFYWSTIGGWAAFVLCVALAFWLVNSKGSVTETMTNGLIATFLIAFLNSFIAFGGCMLVGAASSAIPR